jgi:hypothetical protein
MAGQSGLQGTGHEGRRTASRWGAGFYVVALPASRTATSISRRLLAQGIDAHVPFGGLRPRWFRGGVVRVHWPLAAALAAYVTACGLILAHSLRLNGGRIVYALDDAYIHMAMGRNLFRHGVWGLTDDGFTSSSSSPLWTALVGLGQILAPDQEWIPLVLAFACGAAALAVAHEMLRRRGVSPWFAAAVLLGIVFLTPLPTLVFTGLEHTLHLTLSLAFLHVAGRVLEDSEAGRERAAFYGLGAALGAVRYEGILLVATACVLLLSRRRFGPAVRAGAWALAVPVLYGLWSLAHGWYFLPNSVLMKTLPLDLGSVRGWYHLVLLTPFLRLVATPHVLVLFSVATAFIVAQPRSSDLLWMFAAATYLHLALAQTGWLYRYEAYLVALGLAALAPALDTLTRPPWPRLSLGGVPRLVAVALAATLVVVPLAERSVQAMDRTAQATKNIHEQHYQMGLFLRSYYMGRSVAANDVGAINYLADLHCLDLWGLASQDVGRARRELRYDTATIGELARAHHVSIAVVYEHWFQGASGLPADWHSVGTWTVRGNVVTGGDTVTFFAVDPAERVALQDHLRAFSSRLPPDVVQAGEYVEGGGDTA